MEETNDAHQDSSPEEVVEEVEEVTETEETPAPEEPKEEPKAEKMVPFSRFKEVNDKLAEMKKNPTVKTSLDVEDYIDISASLEGLDQKEKEYLAREHKLSGSPLSEIRKSEDFLLWQTGYKVKAEKERSLKPSDTQAEIERKKNPIERITSAKTLAEQEELLRKAGLYKETRPRSDRSVLG